MILALYPRMDMRFIMSNVAILMANLLFSYMEALVAEGVKV
jgi:hypothetical protein